MIDDAHRYRLNYVVMCREHQERIVFDPGNQPPSGKGAFMMRLQFGSNNMEGNMPTFTPSPTTPFGGFRFRKNKSFAECLPFIKEAECAIISAERAGYTFDENAQRTEALRTRLSNPFVQGKTTYVFDCHMAEGRGIPEREKLCRYLFVAEQRGFKGDAADSPFLRALVDLSMRLQRSSFTFLPNQPQRECRPAYKVECGKASGERARQKGLGTAQLDGAKEKIDIWESSHSVQFKIVGAAPVIRSSMMNAYLFRALQNRQHP